MPHCRLHGFFELCVMHRLVLLVPALDWPEDVTLHLIGCQHVPSAGPGLPRQRLRAAFPAMIPRADDRLAACDSEATSESAEGVTAVSRTVLPEDVVLKGGGVFHHWQCGEALWESE